ncbi:ribosomal protein L11 methyltransferase [Colwellia sp. PAMC 20917]|uniref:50S ribosomal protein L11 methyltransferase n=1 Tax=unclassified Colwellia TaxID=196834 RepID=UPI000878B809|nr:MULTISPECIES: 50S ribosomal protein L11 methyltransferase [unclassified Colwellia]MBA6363566.1 50S ribosomal protein L11 methyltransferase [Colwellia sp. BRX8-8]AOW76965.1 ribosomal protein L11 methyltransferase [Colwellia sp. PAMC 20917]MBA6373467.1 50S ribosomal protein L11 methyltransferase [Colwellia sp. BRX8-4]MBA6381235.1 50S ribosomal protein L11 methyltransferase [Colwellia sp. BRX10-7]MBA6388951.1 50S ribosomal protein L11 methyltransferase [Colwellia sp. BRX10-2]|tara:strand:- start:2980 stop:3861 length:882 start_codon:yes stop_codon:yes gene_type:complete
MPWIQLRLSANEDTSEKYSDWLSACGAQAVTFIDAQDTPIYEPLPGDEVIYWHNTVVMGLFDASHDMDKTITYLKSIHPDKNDMAYKLEQLEDKDWEREWMDNFHPMKFGERLWICPSWREVPDPTAVNVMLDPGLAFGTGTHPTTALCLTWLDGLDLVGKTVVDFGCGSGILSLAALKLGAKKVIGIDIDPQALQASKANAERNGIADRLELFLPKDQPSFKADVVVANILAGPLRELAPTIIEFVAPNGHLALSGVLEEQANELQNIYSQWCEMDAIAVQDEWVRLSGKKN